MRKNHPKRYNFSEEERTAVGGRELPPTQGTKAFTEENVTLTPCSFNTKILWSWVLSHFHKSSLQTGQIKQRPC